MTLRSDRQPSRSPSRARTSGKNARWPQSVSRYIRLSHALMRRHTARRAARNQVLRPAACHPRAAPV